MQVSDFDATQNFPNSQPTRSWIPWVVIVGVGFVGSTTAYALLISGTAATLTSIGCGCRLLRRVWNAVRRSVTLWILNDATSILERLVKAESMFARDKHAVCCADSHVGPRLGVRRNHRSCRRISKRV